MLALNYINLKSCPQSLMKIIRSVEWLAEADGRYSAEESDRIKTIKGDFKIVEEDFANRGFLGVRSRCKK